MDEAMTVLINEFNQLEKRKGNLITLNISVSRALWVMSDIAKEIIYKDNGRDPLTHLFNRRYLNTVLRHETECSLQRNLIFGLVMIDIDFFKKINDTFGHDNGDVVLAQLADILMSQVRAGDFVFRLGGEEFLIVLSDIDEKVLERIGNKLRLEVENTKFILRDEREISLTVSIGAAMHDAHPDFQRTLKRADDALYEAKRNGRNQVVVAKTLNTYVDFAQIA
jgi:diguanylate cyclase